MQSKSDAQLLVEYAPQGAESSFAEIVRRHTNLVYSAALRQVDSSAAAAEITQNAFIGLARGAKSLGGRLAEGASLAGWLCRSARNLSLNHRRDEFRRHSRERQAMDQFISAPDATPDWERLRPVLDEAMSELGEADYDALVLRFYNNQDLRSVGQALGVSEDTAQKRVSRALDKLREHLSRRNVSTTAGALGVVLAANAVQAAPAGLAATISSTAILGGTSLTATAIATKTIAMTTLQKTLITATVTILAGTGIYEAHQASQLRREMVSLQQQQGPLAEQIQRLQQERDESLRQLASLRDANARSDSNSSELLRLRNEVAQLRRVRESEKHSVPPPGAKLVARNSDARYLPKEELANVGYATPLTALQTITWAMMNGSYEQVNQGLSPELLEIELKDPGSREGFEKRQKQMAPLFKGLQIVAQKNVSPDHVELKVKYDTEPIPNAPKEHPEFLVQPMVKVGDEWKFSGSTRSYTPQWEEGGNVVQYKP